MAFTREDLAGVEAAISSGTLSVQYEGRRVQFQSLEDLMKLRARMRAEIEVAEGLQRRRRPRFFRAYQAGNGY
ncbi:hypothetical protein CO641_02385 [Lysobacteraceae bacterium NML91-0213]|nr:hypothetical protein CO641_02385 [Xanthomonadaceae bacterium NML91-0213]